VDTTTRQRDNPTTRPGKISDKKYYIYKFEIEIDSENQQSHRHQKQKEKIQKSKKQYTNLSVAHRNYEKLNKFK